MEVPFPAIDSDPKARCSGDIYNFTILYDLRGGTPLSQHSHKVSIV